MKSKIIAMVAVLCLLLSGLTVSAAGQKKSGKKQRSSGPVTEEFGHLERKQKPAPRRAPAPRPVVADTEGLNRWLVTTASAPAPAPAPYRTERQYLNPPANLRGVGLREGNRAKNPRTRKTEFPVKPNTMLYDSRGNARSVINDPSVKINYGGVRTIKPSPGAKAQRAYSVWFTNLKNGQQASGLVLSQRVLDKPRMPKLMAGRPPSKGVTPYTITGGNRQAQTSEWGFKDRSGNFVPYKVTPGYRGGGRNSTDYGYRPGGYTNLTYNLPGRGGVAFDTFKNGATFQREKSVRSVQVPLYYPGGTRRVGHLTFVYGTVQTPTGPRRGGIPLEALRRRP
jgi:hypothetical protein